MREFLNAFAKLEFEKIREHIKRYAISELGKEHVSRLHPLSSIEEISSGLQATSEMKKLLESDLPIPLEYLPDLRIPLRRTGIEDYSLSASDLNSIAKTLLTARKVSSYFSQRASKYPLLMKEVGSLYLNKILEFNIRQAIDEDGQIKDSASRELQSIRRQIVEFSTSLRRSLESILKRAKEKGWAQEEIITTRDGRMVIPVKSEHRNQLQGFIHSASASGATVFIEPTETLELNNAIRTLQLDESREIARILRGLTLEVRGSMENLLQTVVQLGVLDFVTAKAKYSIELVGSEPVISKDPLLRLSGAFHPILLSKHKRSDVIPLSMELGGAQRTLVITGPNAGGKTVAMKTAGLLCVMALSGCHIPAQPESHIPLLTKLFVDIGDDQSIENDLSSFSSHLQNLKTILFEADSSSLVLIDEIGSGTDPTEGASLAAAIMEGLTDKKTLTIVTAHYGALKQFAFEHGGMVNGAMEFDQKQLLPTYRFRSGVPGSSYALEIARRIGLPATVVARSVELGGTNSNKLEFLIADLEDRSQSLRAEMENAKSKSQQLEELIENYTQKRNSLDAEVKELRARAKREASEILERTNALIERTVREIREENASKDIVRKARTEIARHAAEVETDSIEHSERENGDKQVFNPGDTVVLLPSGATGEVLAKIDDNHYQILSGNIKLQVKAKALERTVTERLKSPASKHVPDFPDVKSEIDLRGMYGDEAIHAVEHFLEDAILAGLHRVDIIHGKGTGSLRRRVTELLKRDRRLKSFRLGSWNEGGAGVTVVELP